MAGLLTPQSSSMLIGALRKEFPEVPIHVHTHDTLGALQRLDTGIDPLRGRRVVRRRRLANLGHDIVQD
jgi:hypothetical protein